MNYKPRLSDRVHDAIADKDNAIALADEVEALEQRVEGLKREVCTCPWPEDAAKTRHLLSCRLMQMEHEALAEEQA